MTREEVLEALQTIHGLPLDRGARLRGRTIYEAGDINGKGSGRFYIDYAAYPGGTSQQVPLSVIWELESEGLIVRSYSDRPDIASWKLRG